MTFQTHPARPPGRAAPRHEPGIERLRARIAELEREKAATEAFAAEAAHELLTPLVMIAAYATMAAEQLDDEFDADALRNLDALQRGAVRTRMLVETLLHAASSPGGPLRRSVVDLNTVLGDCLSLLAPEIHSRGADLRGLLEPAHQRAQVRTAPQRDDPRGRRAHGHRLAAVGSKPRPDDPGAGPPPRLRALQPRPR